MRHVAAIILHTSTAVLSILKYSCTQVPGIASTIYRTKFSTAGVACTAVRIKGEHGQNLVSDYHSVLEYAPRAMPRRSRGAHAGKCFTAGSPTGTTAVAPSHADTEFSTYRYRGYS
jgi:hypothetical protein